MKPESHRNQESSNAIKCHSLQNHISAPSNKVGESSVTKDNIGSQYKILSLGESTQQKTDEAEYSGNSNKRRSSPYMENLILSSSENESDNESGSDHKDETARAFINSSQKIYQPKKIIRWQKKIIKKEIPQQKFYLDTLPEDALDQITNFSGNNDIINLLFVSKKLLNIFKSSGSILKKFTLQVDKYNFEKFEKYTLLYDVPLRKISFDFKGFSNLGGPLRFLNNFKNSVENLCIRSAKFKNSQEFSQLCENLKSIKSLSFQNCGIDQIGSQLISILPTLETVLFNKCNDNIYKAFKNQNSITKIEVGNDDWTWNGFPHEIFNETCKSCRNLKHIVLTGAGTGSYFDADEFPYKIRKLETTMITFHWYVGIKTERVSFLRSQRGHLKELTIHQLPNDFDGGKVLKFIFAEMKLDTFYYGKIPLILNGKKQEVKEFAATEIQIRSALELIEQFPSITSYILILSSTDIASDEIEKVINPRNNFYRQLKKFEVIDNSRYRGLFGVFLGLLKNLANIETLSLKTQDRNINVLLEESLPFMTEIRELYLPSMAPRGKERLTIIKSLAPSLTKLSIADQFVDEAKMIFDRHVEICGIPGSSENQMHIQRQNWGTNPSLDGKIATI